MTDKKYSQATSKNIQMSKVVKHKFDAARLQATFSNPIEIEFSKNDSLFINEMDFIQDFSLVISKKICHGTFKS